MTNNSITLHQGASTFIYLLYFLMGIAGMLEMLVFLLLLQLLFSSYINIKNKPLLKHSLKWLKRHNIIIFYSLLIWLVAIAVTFIITLASNNQLIEKLASSLRLAYLLTLTLYFFSLSFLIKTQRINTDKVLLLFGLGFIAFVTLQLLLLALGPTPDSYLSYKHPFLSPNIREAGMMAACASLIFAGKCLFSRKKATPLFAAFFTLSLAYLFWTGGRMGCIATLLTLLVLCAWSFSQKEQIHKRNIALLLLCIPLAYYLSSHFFIFEWNGLGHTQRRINETNLNELSSGRVEIWQWAIAAIKEQPWFGHGLYGFYFLEARKASEFIYDHPHNSLLQMAVEWGIPASLALISILATLFFQAIKRMFYANVKTDFTIAVCLIAYLSMHSLTSASYWSLQPLNVLILAFAIIACCLQHQEQPKQAK